MATNDIRFVGAERLSRTIDRLRRNITSRQILGEIGQFIRLRVTNRTQQEGVDIYGRPFEPYSPRYAFWRQQAGYQTDFVDLTVTGGMFNSLTYEATENQVRVFFMPGKTRGSKVENPAKAFYLQQDREFFGMSDQDVQEIMDMYDIHIGETMRGR